jgi:hypothetical protein
MKIKYADGVQTVKTSHYMILLCYWHLHFLTGCDIFFLRGACWNGTSKEPVTQSEVIIHEKYYAVIKPQYKEFSEF